jgi:MbtH protein
MPDNEEDQSTYRVVVNLEEQYSIVPAWKTNSPGWRDAGKSGTKAECLEYVEREWRDMRPLSLRRSMHNGS